MEKIIFPMKNMRITTGVNMLSHKGGNDIDNAGKDGGKDDVFAPFTGTIKKIYKNGNTVWLESNEKVLYADGALDYAVFYATHDSDVSNLHVGKVIKQGEVFYQEGTANASAAHVHMGIGKGKYTSPGWKKTGYKWNGVETWVINNSYEPWKAFWLKDVNVINGMNYPWKRIEGEDMDEYEAKGLYRYGLFREPENDQVWRPWLGKTMQQGIDSFMQSSEWKSKRDKVNKYDGVVKERDALKKQNEELKKQLEQAGGSYVQVTEPLYRKK